MADSIVQLERRRAEMVERHANELQDIDDKIGTIKLQEVEALKKQASSAPAPSGRIPSSVQLLVECPIHQWHEIALCVYGRTH